MNVSDDANVEAIRKQETRESVNNQTLGGEALEDFEAGLIGFRRLEPRIEEMQRRFKILSKENKVGGAVQTIEGCMNFKQWCEEVLGKPVGVVYYLLRGGPKKSEPKEKSDELRSLRFSKEDLKKLDIFFSTYLGENSTKKEREELLHKTFEEYLSALTA